MKRIAAVLLALVLTPSAAFSDPLTAAFNGVGLGAAVAGSNSGSAFSVWAGQIRWDGPGATDFLSYCVDLTTMVANPQTFATEVPGNISSSDAEQIAYLVATHFYGVTNNWMAAGLQLAIWNVLYDSDYTLAGGSFTSSTDGAAGYANSFLSDLQGHRGSLASVTFLNTSNGQDQVTVPEPSTLVVLGLGLFGAATNLRRRTKKP